MTGNAITDAESDDNIRTLLHNVYEYLGRLIGRHHDAEPPDDSDDYSTSPRSGPHVKHFLIRCCFIADSRFPLSTIQKHKSVEERIKPTLNRVTKLRRHYQLRSLWLSWMINIALGLQVILGALITGVAASSTPKGAQVSTSILGGASTLLAGFLARMKGSDEPATSRIWFQAFDKVGFACCFPSLSFFTESPVLKSQIEDDIQTFIHNFGEERPDPHRSYDKTDKEAPGSSKDALYRHLNKRIKQLRRDYFDLAWQMTV